MTHCVAKLVSDVTSERVCERARITPQRLCGCERGIGRIVTMCRFSRSFDDKCHALCARLREKLPHRFLYPLFHTGSVTISPEFDYSHPFRMMRQDSSSQQLLTERFIMDNFYKPLAERTPDTQYQDRLKYILEHGEMALDTPQGVPALTCFGTLAPMVFNLSNGVPLITERSMEKFWKKPVGEIIAFINGARTIDEIESYGCTGYWEDYRGKGTMLGLDPDDLGPGSYGPAFHDFPMSDGKTFDQFKHIVEQIRELPYLKTHVVTPWIPYHTVRGKGKARKVVVAPCHGWVFVNILGGTLYLYLLQRSADIVVGVPSNFVQYSALTLMLAHLTGYKRAVYIHSFFDAHVYENQIPWAREILSREPRPFPTLSLTEEGQHVSVIHDFRREHFALTDYDPHPALTGIPVAL